MKHLTVGRRFGVAGAIGILALLAVAPAGAQENLDHGKSAAQLFSSNCAICHKSAQALNKSGGPLGFGMESFLREHYTASKETAALLAKYVQGLESAPAGQDKRPRRSAKGSDGPKADGKKSDSKSGQGKTDQKAGDSKPTDDKSDAAKTDAAKTDAAKTDDTKPADAKASDAKTSEAKPRNTKPRPPKPAGSAKPDKPDAPEKSD